MALLCNRQSLNLLHSADKTLRYLLLAFGVAASVAGPAAADSGRLVEPAAIAVYFQGNPVAAFEELDRRARSGDAIAQYFVARAWLRGHGTGVDPAVAYAWFAASEANGHWPGRQARRRLHSRLRIGELPRGERLARRYVSRYSPRGIQTPPCFAGDAGRYITSCGNDPQSQSVSD